MFSKKTSTLRASWLLLSLLFITCSEDEPKSFGNDDALLTNINFGSSVALISRVTTDNITTVDAHRYFHEQLLSVNQAGILNEAAFSITGNGDGFDKYALNDINDMYFLISFYLRKESYFVDKKTGNAVRSAYVNTEKLSMNDSYNDMHPHAFYGVHNTNFYFKDSDEQWFHVSNFLSGGAAAEPITFDKFPQKLFFDSKGGVYYINQYSLYYFSNGISTLVVTDHVGIFSDRDGNLKVVGEDGKVSTVLDGAMSLAFNVPGQVYYWNQFKVFHFEELDKSLVIYTQKTSGNSILYDLDSQVKKMDLTNEDGNSFYIVSADSYDNFLMIVHEAGDRRVLRIVDVTTYEFREVDVTGLESNLIEGFYAVSENLMLADVCRMEAGGACHEDIKTLKSSGAAQPVATNSAGGKIITLN